jgi:YegS/Rv2252/BmrU family lipid kinase
MSRIVVILNPAARGEKAKTLWEKVRRLSEDALVRITSEAGEARELAKQAAQHGCEIVVAAGGDGTVNEVVNGISGSDVALGLLPIGTMNVFAAELGIPANNLRKCWEIIEAGNVREVDLPVANRHAFVQLAGIGFDAQIVQETSRDFRKNFGPLSYIVTATQIASRTPPNLIVEANGKQKKGSFVLIGNGRFYGGPFVIFNDAKVDDGKLDVLIFKNLGYLDIVRYLSGIVFGKHVDMHDVEYFQTKKVVVRGAAENSVDVPVEVDGEVIGNLPVMFRMSPHKLKVVSSARA